MIHSDGETMVHILKELKDVRTHTDTIKHSGVSALFKAIHRELISAW